MNATVEMDGSEVVVITDGDGEQRYPSLEVARRIWAEWLLTPEELAGLSEKGQAEEGWWHAVASDVLAKLSRLEG